MFRHLRSDARLFAMLLPTALGACSSDQDPSSTATGAGSQTANATNTGATVGGSAQTSSGAATTDSSTATSTTSTSGVGGATNSTTTQSSTQTAAVNTTSSSGGGSTTAGATTGGGVPVGSPVDQHGQLRVDGTTLVDAAGTPVQLKGASSMWLHWEDDGYAENLEALIWMRDHWNLSVIRAAMGIEPMGAYLTDKERAQQQVTAVVENAIQAGVYVIIDWHDHNAQDHQSEAEAFFADMAARYGDTPNVIYEPYNEPEQVDWGSVVKPYHEALVSTIRAADPDNLIVLGTPSWSQAVDVAASNPVAGTNLLYTLHFYACSHTGWLRDQGNTALTMGAPLFVTEWGATDADGGVDGETCLEEAALWHDWMNQNNISWTAWKLDGCDDSSCYFGPMGAPVMGGWTDEYLHGHAPFVRDRMLE